MSDLVEIYKQAGRRHLMPRDPRAALPVDSTVRDIIGDQFMIYFRRCDPGAKGQPYQDQELCDLNFAWELAEKARLSRPQIITILRASWAAFVADDPTPSDAYFESIARDVMRRVRGKNEAKWDRPGVLSNRRNPLVRNAEIVEAIGLREDLELFGLGNCVVEAHTIRGRTNQEALTTGRAKRVVAKAADLVSASAKGGINQVGPSNEVAEGLLQSAADFRPLVRMVRLPFFRPDGTLCTTPGYDAASQIYLAPDPDFALGEIPPHSEEDLAQAKETLLRVLTDFPFVSPADRAHVLAALVQGIARDMIEGPTPICVIAAPASRSGKGLLLYLICQILWGRMDAGVLPENEHEVQQLILAKLLEGIPAIIFDNLHKRLDSAAVAAAVAEVWYTGRRLTKTDAPRVPQRASWFVTGNNPAFSAEIANRIYWIRLDARVPNPGARRGPDGKERWTIPNLRRHVRENRAELLRALYVICRAWIEQGRPAPSDDVPRLGGFEAWTEVVGGIVQRTLGEPFMANEAESRDAGDEETEEWGAFVAAIEGRFGTGESWTAAAVAHLVASRAEPLFSTLPASVGEPESRGFRERLGNQLKRQADRRYAQEDGGVIRIAKVMRDGKHRKDPATQRLLYRIDRAGGSPVPPGINAGEAAL